MMRFLAAAAMAVFAGGAHAEEVARIASNADAATTSARLKAAVEKRGFVVFAEVDHAKGAQGVGLQLRPTTLLIFGNPRGGTPLMQCNQAIGLELPLKMLVLQAEDGKVQVVYSTIADVLARHGASNCSPPVVANVTKALGDIAAEAAGK